MGGLTNCLARATLCLEYAIREKRAVVFDTIYSGGFRDSFCHYFELRDKNNSDIIPSLSPELTQQLNATYIYPRELNLSKGGLMIRRMFPSRFARCYHVLERLFKKKNPLQYEIAWSAEHHCFVERKTRVVLAVDLHKRNAEQVLLYHSDGTFKDEREFKKLYTLATHLRFTPKLTAAIKKAIAPYQNTPYNALFMFGIPTTSLPTSNTLSRFVAKLPASDC